eukprot:TCONS_00003814-protein
MLRIPNEEKAPNIQITPSESIPISPQTNEEKVVYLVRQTGIEKEIAREFLESNGWNLQEALIGYKQLVQHEKQAEEEKHDQTKLSTYDFDKRKVSRGFSLSNFKIIQDEREKQKTLVCQESTTQDSFKVLGPSSRESFVLPDISMLDKDVAYIIKTELISKSALHKLTNVGRLNWWTEMGTCRKLFPLLTVGDGNCLLHAASLGMWGFHDRMLILRKALYQMFLNPIAIKALKRRWKYNMWVDNMKCGGLTFTRQEWDTEWNTVVGLTSNVSHKLESDSSQNCKRITRQISLSSSNSELEEGESLDSLEPIHVYALSNLLCRPIIVLSEDMLKDAEGRPIAPIPFGGIYLPLEQDVSKCYKYPLILAFESSHFSALVPADGDNLHNGEKLSSSVPLQNKDLAFLDLKFAMDPGSTWDMVQDDSVKEERMELTLQEKIILLRKYMDVVKVPSKKAKPAPPPVNDLRVGSVIDHVHNVLVGRPENLQPPAPEPDIMLVCAKISMKNRPKHYKEMIQNFIDTKMVEAKELRDLQNRCPNCGAEGFPHLKGYCEWCFERAKMVGGKSPSPKQKSPISTLVRRTNKLLIGEPDNNKNQKQNLLCSPPSPRTSSKTLPMPAKKKENNSIPSTQNVTQDEPLPMKSRSADNIHYPPSMRGQQTREQIISQEEAGFYRSQSLSNRPEVAPLNPSLSRPQTSEPSSRPQISRPLSDPQNTNESQPSRPQTSPNTSSSTSPGEFVPGKPCKVSGCNFYGSNQTLGFCSGCYRQYNH